MLWALGVRKKKENRDKYFFGGIIFVFCSIAELELFVSKMKPLPDGRYHCHLCSGTYGTKADLFKHLNNKHGKDSVPTQCGFCTKQFRNRKSLAEHMRAFHTGQNALKRFPCQYCSATYSKDCNRKRHEQNRCVLNPNIQDLP